MRRYIRGHTHRYPLGTDYQKDRKSGGQNHRLFERIVIVRDKIHSFFIEVFEQRLANAAHAHFRVPHCRWRIAIHASEISLTVDEHVPHGKRLGHSDDGIVNRGVTVRMILTDHITDSPCGLPVSSIPEITAPEHGIENSPVHRFETVSQFREGPADDHAHRVIQIGFLDLFFDTYSCYVMQYGQACIPSLCAQKTSGFRI